MASSLRVALIIALAMNGLLRQACCCDSVEASAPATLSACPYCDQQPTSSPQPARGPCHCNDVQNNHTYTRLALLTAPSWDDRLFSPGPLTMVDWLAPLADTTVSGAGEPDPLNGSQGFSLSFPILFQRLLI